MSMLHSIGFKKVHQRLQQHHSPAHFLPSSKGNDDMACVSQIGKTLGLLAQLTGSLKPPQDEASQHPKQKNTHLKATCGPDLESTLAPEVSTWHAARISLPPESTPLGCLPHFRLPLHRFEPLLASAATRSWCGIPWQDPDRTG